MSSRFLSDAPPRRPRVTTYRGQPPASRRDEAVEQRHAAVGTSAGQDAPGGQEPEIPQSLVEWLSQPVGSDSPAASACATLREHQIPSNCPQDHLSGELPPFESLIPPYLGCLSPSRHATASTPKDATEPEISLQWRKLHLAIDAASGMIVARLLTDQAGKRPIPAIRCSIGLRAALPA